MANFLRNGEPESDTFKAGAPAKAYVFTTPAKGNVWLLTSTSTVMSANSTIAYDGQSETHRAQTNIMGPISLPAGTHQFTVSSDKDARFAVSYKFSKPIPWYRRIWK